jgi:WXXGXW repeat (2 copies)
MHRRSITPFIFAATGILPGFWSTGAALAQPVTRPASNITPHDARSVIAPALPVPPPPPPQPVITRALLPGHWALQGARYVWVPPETTLRRVQSAGLVPGAYVWRNGAYLWVPTHYEN